MNDYNICEDDLILIKQAFKVWCKLLYNKEYKPTNSNINIFINNIGIGYLLEYGEDYPIFCNNSIPLKTRALFDSYLTNFIKQHDRETTI